MKTECRFLTASFTVELALLFPVIMLVILSVLYIDAQYMNSSCFKSLACEQSISGRDSGYNSYFALKSVKRSEDDTENERTVTFDTGTKGIYSIFDFDINVSATYKKIYPASVIRNARLISGMTGHSD